MGKVMFLEDHAATPPHSGAIGLGPAQQIVMTPTHTPTYGMTHEQPTVAR